MTTPHHATVLLAGGGTGGHIFPNLAILERLREQRASAQPLLLISQRAVDRRIVDAANVPSHALPAQPLRRSPLGLLRCLRGYRQSKRIVRRLIAEHHVKAIVTTGGFVSGPAMAAAKQAGVPSAMVNLDAVPGRANRMMAPKADHVFSVYKTKQLPGAQLIGLPLRCGAVSDRTVGQARVHMGLAPDRPTLLVTAGSQGAASINRMMIAWCAHATGRAMLNGWQVLHLAGDSERDAVAEAYASASVPAEVLTFCDQMGLAWRAASVAISRAGAGSVAEAWANGVPTLFYPYPYHKDEHQRLNAEPMVGTGGALLLRDLIDPAANLTALLEPFAEVAANPARLEIMRGALAAHQPPDGAAAVAAWVGRQV